MSRENERSAERWSSNPRTDSLDGQGGRAARMLAGLGKFCVLYVGAAKLVVVGRSRAGAPEKD